MKKIVLILAVFVSVLACKVNPFTGKKVLNFYPNSQIFPMAFAQYDHFLTENAVVETANFVCRGALVGCQWLPRIFKRLQMGIQSCKGFNGQRLVYARG